MFYGHLPTATPPCLLPQGQKGDDTLSVIGDYGRLWVRPASALTALDPVFFRRGTRATTC